MSLRLGEVVVAGSVDLTDYDTTKINTTSLSIQPSPGSGFTVFFDSQVRIEHKAYYEYFVEVTATGGSRSATDQTPVALISGFAGKGLQTHTPLPMWNEQGKDNTNGLVYSGSLTDTTLSLYIGKTSSTDALRFNIHLIRMK